MSALIIRLPNHLGDACMSLAALGLLADSGHELTLTGRAWATSLFAAYPWPVIALPATRGERLRTLRDWRNRHAGGRGLLLTNSFSTALEFRLAGLRPFGYAADGRRFLLSQAVARPRRGDRPHMVEYYYRLAARFARTAPPVPAELSLRVTEQAAARARELLRAAGVNAPYVVLCPVAVGLHRGKVKAWSGFAQLCDRLRARGVAVVSCPGPGERDAVMRAVPNAPLLAETDVGTFAALLAASRLVVANDSGSGHIAAAVGAPLVSVFGVTEPAETRPWGARVTIVGSGSGWPAYEEVEAAVERALAA
ncbi:MAG: glycosyltransferase family 9 protein [Gemmatimonadota bacterium]